MEFHYSFSLEILVYRLSVGLLFFITQKTNFLLAITIIISGTLQKGKHF